MGFVPAVAGLVAESFIYHLGGLSIYLRGRKRGVQKFILLRVVNRLPINDGDGLVTAKAVRHFFRDLLFQIGGLGGGRFDFGEALFQLGVLCAKSFDLRSFHN